MLKNLKKNLPSAEGRSEFIVAVVCDIRGFSAFSSVHESPDIAMFVKRFYLKLLNDYFITASFAKPTGDGLLMTFGYSEKTLHKVVDLVLKTCFRALTDFPKMFQNDPMINFPTPTDLGFGIARGPACCLFSGRHIIDYSGHLLNLTARLNDLARPRGVVVDGAFQMNVLPETIRSDFIKRHAYIRSIAEDSSKEILCSKDVTLPDYALTPLGAQKWELNRKELLVSELKKLSGKFSVKLPEEFHSKEKTKLKIIYPNKQLSGYSKYKDYAYDCFQDASGSHYIADSSEAKSIATSERLSPKEKIFFEFQYLPKAKAKPGKSGA